MQLRKTVRAHVATPGSQCWGIPSNASSFGVSPTHPLSWFTAGWGVGVAVCRERGGSEIRHMQWTIIHFRLKHECHSHGESIAPHN